MTGIELKAWLATAVLGLSASLLVYACVVPQRNDAPIAKQLERAQGTPAVQGSIGMLTYSHPLDWIAAKQVAMDRLDEVEYYADDPCPGGCGDYPHHCAPDEYSQQIATAIVTPTNTLTVGLVSLTNDGVLNQVGSDWPDPGATEIQKVAVAALDRNLFVVGTRNKDKTLTLRVFDVTASGPRFKYQYVGKGDNTDTGEIALGDFAMTRVAVRNDDEVDGGALASNPTDTALRRLAVAYTTSTDQKLSVTSFAIDVDADKILRMSTFKDDLSSAKVVSIAAPQRPHGVFATGSVGTDDKVTLVSWTMHDGGHLYRGGSTTLGSTSYSDLVMAPAGYRRVAIYAKGSTSAKLASFDINGADTGTTLSLRDDLVDSATPLSSATLVSGGSSRLYLVGKSGADLYVRSYLSVTELQALENTRYTNYGASSGIAATVFESSWLTTASIDASSGQVRMHLWRDYHVPLTSGFWPTTAARVPEADAGVPGDNKTTFPFDPDLSQPDFSIAASDQYLVACKSSSCTFLNKAGKPLADKYVGESGSGADIGAIFAPVVGKPGGSPVPSERSMLRHLEYQHACDPELPSGTRNRCPTEPYDSSVTYDTTRQRFVIVTNFRFKIGCGEMNARYPAVAVSATTDPRDGFFVYASLEGGGRDCPRVSTRNGMTIVGWNAEADNRTLGATAEVFELSDLMGSLDGSVSPRAVPRVTKLDRSQVRPIHGDVPLSFRGDVPLGMIIEHVDSEDKLEHSGRLWYFPKATVGRVSPKPLYLRYPFRFTSGDEISNMADGVFKQVGSGLYDGHLYRSGGGFRVGVMDYNFRYKSDTNDLWLAGVASQQFDCERVTKGDKLYKLSCKIYGIAADDKGRVLLNYTSVYDDKLTDIGSEGWAASKYALLPRPTAPPIRALVRAGDAYHDQTPEAEHGKTQVKPDFAVPFADPLNEGFWTIADSATTTSYMASAARVMPDSVPSYTGLGRMWLTDTTTQPATLRNSYTWEKTDIKAADGSVVPWSSTWRQVVHGDFDGGSGGLEEIFAYDDKAGTGRFYSASFTGLSQSGGTSTGLGSALYVVALEVCGGSGNLCPGGIGNNTRELLFYDWVKGERAVWRISNTSTMSLTQIGTTDSTPHTWSLIVAGDFTSDAGDEVVFYDPTKGELQFNALSASGSFTSSKSNLRSEIDGNATAIVSGDFDADALDEIYVYTPYSSRGRFYTLDSSGAMTQTGSNYNTRGTWAGVGTIGNASSVLVEYDPTQPPDRTSPARDGTIRFSKITNGAVATWNDVTLLGTGDGRNWSNVVIGDFLTSSQKEILFYRQIAPVARPGTAFNPATGCSNDASYIMPGEGLGPNQFINSCDSRFRLIMQSDGNLVLYEKNGSGNYATDRWATGTNQLVIDAVKMETGDFAIYNPDGAVVWNTNTGTKAGVHLKLSNTGATWKIQLYSSQLGSVWERP